MVAAEEMMVTPGFAQLGILCSVWPGMGVLGVVCGNCRCLGLQCCSVGGTELGHHRCGRALSASTSFLCGAPACDEASGPLMEDVRIVWETYRSDGPAERDRCAQFQ